MKKIVVTVPVKDADRVRHAIGEVGGGKIGNYTFCSFSTRGIGRFMPEDGSHPAIGEPGTFQEVEEERIEVSCGDGMVNDVIEAIRHTHPYEEPAIDVYALG